MEDIDDPMSDDEVEERVKGTNDKANEGDDAEVMEEDRIGEEEAEEADEADEEEEESPVGDNNIEEEQEYGEYFDHAELPDELKGLRACLSCSLVKTYIQFSDQGCDNCEHLRMKDYPRKVKSCTTTYFEGLIALVEPQNSWVAKWQRIVQMKPGMYAIQVTGHLQDDDELTGEDDDMIDDM